MDSSQQSLHNLGAEPLFNVIAQKHNPSPAPPLPYGAPTTLPVPMQPQAVPPAMSIPTPAGVPGYPNTHPPPEFKYESPLSYGTPETNPISFLNTLYQKLKLTAPPDYKFIQHPNGMFAATLRFHGREYVSPYGRVKKQEAKEDVARQALMSLNAEIPETIMTLRGELTRNQLLPKLPKVPKGSNNQPPKVTAWWESVKLANKRPVVYLLEFCQQYKLGQPTYKPISDHNGNYTYELQIGDRLWRGDLAMYAKKEAQDHVADIAFRVLYHEQVGIESQHEAYQCYEPLNAPSVPPPMFPFGAQAPPTAEPSLVRADIPIKMEPDVDVPDPTTTASASAEQFDHNRFVGTMLVNPSLKLSSSPPSGGGVPSIPTSSTMPVTSHSLGPPPTSAAFEQKKREAISPAPVYAAPPPHPSVTPIPVPSIPTTGSSYRPTVVAPVSPVQVLPQFVGASPVAPSQPQPPVTQFAGYSPYGAGVMFDSRARAKFKKYVSLLYETAQSRKTDPPHFEIHVYNSAFWGEVRVMGLMFQGSKLWAKKADAKEDVAETAYKYITDNYQV